MNKLHLYRHNYIYRNKKTFKQKSESSLDSKLIVFRLIYQRLAVIEWIERAKSPCWTFSWRENA